MECSRITPSSESNCAHWRREPQVDLGQARAHAMMKLLALFLPLGTFAASAADYTLHTFKRIQLNDQFWSEGANFADLNNDGKNDIISGPWWWEGPDFTKRHEIYAPTKGVQTPRRITASR